MRRPVRVRRRVTSAARLMFVLGAVGTLVTACGTGTLGTAAPAATVTATPRYLIVAGFVQLHGPQTHFYTMDGHVDADEPCTALPGDYDAFGDGTPVDVMSTSDAASVVATGFLEQGLVARMADHALVCSFRFRSWTYPRVWACMRSTSRAARGGLYPNAGSSAVTTSRSARRRETSSSHDRIDDRTHGRFPGRVPIHPDPTRPTNGDRHCTGAEPSSMPTVTGGGDIAVYGTNTHWTAATSHPRPGDSCSPSGEFADVGNGGVVIVRDGDDMAVASSTVGEGTVTTQLGEKTMSCVFPFIVGVPSGRGPYRFEIGPFYFAPMSELVMLHTSDFKLGKP